MTGANVVRVLLTGTNGVVGQALCRRLYQDEKHEVGGAVIGDVKFISALRTN